MDFYDYCIDGMVLVEIEVGKFLGEMDKKFQVGRSAITVNL